MCWSGDNAAKTLFIMVIMKIPENDFFHTRINTQKIEGGGNWIRIIVRQEGEEIS